MNSAALKSNLVLLWSKRTAREKAIFVVAALFLAVFVGYPVLVEPVIGAFSEQSHKLERIRKAYESAPKSLERYAKLLSRRKEIDAFYSKADLSAAPVSHIEGLLRTLAQAAPGSYNVSPKEGIPIGGKYTHRFIDVSFQTTSYENLVAFLKELTGGKQPMLISRIDLMRNPGSSMLSVKLDVSGFELIGQ
jgi:type II secretory pathway component PulM